MDLFITFTAKLENKREVANKTLEVTYYLLGKKVDFKPGQYFFVTLPGNLRHHFTIVNSPNEKGILTHTTRLRDTKFKNTLKDLSLETEIEVGEIAGDFVLPDDSTKPLVFIALGIGITPYVSMTRFIKEEEKDYRITLFYSDSDKESMAYLSEFENYTKENPNFKIILTITHDENWTGEKRHINGDFLKDYLDNPKEYLYYISGPANAVDAVSKSLMEAGIEKENIKTESFSGY